MVAPARPLLHLYSDAAALRSLFRRGVIDLALGNAATLGDQRASVVASVPAEGTISTERVLGVVAGTRRAVCARRVAGALLAPAAQARLAAARGLLPVRTATCAALSERRLHDPPAGALADAREQLHGDSSGGFGGCHGLAGMGG